MRAFYVVRLVCGPGFGVLLATGAQAQVGHVVGLQKVSDTAGGFTAPLRDEDQLGRSIVRLGDLDGDGITDLLVGAHTDDDGGLDKGSVYVLFMHANGSVRSWTKISDLSGDFAGRLHPGDQFGRAAACVGDLDLDGVPDVVVSANYDDDGGTNKGAVYVLFLRRDGGVKASQKISSSQGGLPAVLHIHDEFGRSITCLGDLDGDGVSDIVVGTPEDDDGGTNTGALHVLFLERDGTVKAYRRISRSTDALRLKPGDWFGHSSASLGDFDHDGVTDLVVGSVLDDDGGLNQGSVWILFLNRDGSVKASREINEITGGFTAVLDDVDQFGTSVACLGDLDGDGVPDIAVGAVKDDDGGNPGNPDADVGAVYVLFLQADASVKSWVKISDTSGDLPARLDQYDWFGSALCPLGGSPGDGLFNLAIGCRNDDDGGPNRGAVFLVQLNDGSAPTADFEAGSSEGPAPLSVAFRDRSSGAVTAWLWSFGDGTQSNQQNPTKTYAAPGVYDVSLTARGPRGRDVETKGGYVTVLSGVSAVFEASPHTGLAPLEVVFDDRSEGSVTSWVWDFGDGTVGGERSPRHVYGPGTFTVSLTVSGPGGTSRSVLVGAIQVADSAPSADFSASDDSGRAPLDVTFTDLSSGLVTARTWDFGDGTGSSQRDPAHRYTLPGTYLVRLQVSGPGGHDTSARAVLITVLAPPPEAAFEVSTTTGPAPLAVRFDDRSTGAVSAWSWSFGDGSTSDERAPTHTYAVPGTYTVALAIQGPDGSDVEAREGLVHVLDPAPVADFAAGPATGFAPLTVAFSDLSRGAITSWLWAFGDGTRARSRSPAKVYTFPGDYAVTLTVQGPGGKSSITRGGISVRRMPVLSDGGFEADATGLAPGAPWRLLAGTASVVRSSEDAETDFPSAGVHWCEIAAEGSRAATPPSNPGGEGEMPVGAVGIERGFPFDPLAPHLVFDAAFVPGTLPEENTPEGVFMSIDLSDGVHAHNVFHADGSAELAGYSEVHALPMSARRRVHVDLRELFADLPAGTPLELRVSVGNEGAGSRPAWGYVDSFQLVPGASASPRNGSGRNAFRYQSSRPVLGGEWRILVDTSGFAGVRTIQLVGAQLPATGALKPSGELLVSGKKLFAQSWPALPGVNERTIALPLDLALMGTSMATQVSISGGGKVELCNAWDLVFGF